MGARLTGMLTRPFDPVEVIQIHVIGLAFV